MDQNPTEIRFGCYDEDLDFQEHEPIENGQRFLSPSNGKCKRLKVQSIHVAGTHLVQENTDDLPVVQPTANYDRVGVSHNHPHYIAIAVELCSNIPRRISPAVLIWILEWFALWLAVTWEMLVVAFSPYFNKVPSGRYPRYAGRFWDQFWEAKSSREFSLHRATLHRNPSSRLPLSKPGFKTVDADAELQILESEDTLEDDITRAEHPRQLMVDPQFVLDNLELDDAQKSQAEKHLRDSEWMPIIQDHGHDQYLATAKYLAVSYRRGAYRRGPGKSLDKNLEEELFANIRRACEELDVKAYWFDEQCMGETWAEKNVDLFRIADVFRGAAATVIMIPDHGKSPETVHGILGEKEEWELWGERVWTFPEALLSSKHLFYKLGRGQTTSIQLRQLTNLAFRDHKEAGAIIDHYSGTDVLSRLQFLSLLKDAIWGRPHFIAPATAERSVDDPPPAERVYALMGFFEHRIMPDNLETEEQALARLSMANDSDRFTERMISMLPSTIRSTACWYSDNDHWETKLWDIEPVVQVAGITESGSLVFNGCRAAANRWKNFPSVTRRTKRGFKRDSATCATILAPVLLIFGGIFTKFLLPFGVTLVVISILIMIAAPFLIVYTISGRVKRPEPWLIGVEGALSAEDTEYYLYAHKPAADAEHKFKDSATGSQFAEPDGTRRLRLGKTVYPEVSTREQRARAERNGQKLFTLVDTMSSTIYYFSARSPPSVCVFMGREGGLGRYVLCSEHCDKGELHKESVLRMPTYLSDKMEQCDWVAIGHTARAEHGTDVQVIISQKVSIIMKNLMIRSS